MFLLTGSGREGTAKELVQALVDARVRGVSIRVLLDKDAERDVYKTRLINSRAAALLRRQEVEVRFDPPDRLMHSKLVIVDDVVAIVGSHNWTRASLETYHEASVVLRSAGAVPQLCTRFEALWSEGTDVTP
jgi:phosphatidylserine/phosphatidylglycerophosphate/cardiolipin synthase-like enzyme